MNKVTPIVETKKVSVGAKIKGFGTQSVEIRNYTDETPESHVDPLNHNVMIMVNGRDTDVAYVRKVDLIEALRVMGVIE